MGIWHIAVACGFLGEIWQLKLFFRFYIKRCVGWHDNDDIMIRALMIRVRKEMTFFGQ